MSVLDYFRDRNKPPPERKEPHARGGSGRGHAFGFLELEELNNDLRHPACHRVYDTMFRGDADIKQVIGLVSNPILSGTWSVEPYGGQEAEEADVAVAESVKWALFDFMCPNLIGHLAEFLPIIFRSGFCPGEIVWGVGEHDGKKLIAPRTVEVRLPRSVWRWNQKWGRLTSIEQFLPSGSAGSNSGHSFEYDRTYGSGANMGLGSVQLDAKNLIYYRVGAEGDNWEGVSLLRPAYKHWFIKDTVERIDAIAQEREALGVPLLYPPPGATPAQLDAMEEILKNFRKAQQGYVVMPGMKAGVAGTPDGAGWLLELMGFDRTGSGRDPQPTLDYHSNKIAAAMIAEFLDTEKGTKATVSMQADPFQMAVEALVTTSIEVPLNEAIVKPFVAWNHPEATNPPKLKMSLVDSTSLSQLADFVLKLTQVGALLPDQELEDFLRARADMPPANAESVRQRGEDEEMIRRMIVGGNINPTPADEVAHEQEMAQAEMGAKAGLAGEHVKAGVPSNRPDPFGSNAKVGKHKHGKPDTGGRTKKPKNGNPAGRGAAGQGAARGPAKLSDAGYEPQPDGGMVTDEYAASHHEHSRWWELHVDLDGLDSTMSGMPHTMQAYCGQNMRALAAEMADPSSPIGDMTGSSGAKKGMRDDIHACLHYGYDQGAGHVHDELGALGLDLGSKRLDRGARDRGGAHLAGRADLAAEGVEQSMRQTIVGHDLAHGQPGRAQAAAEKAGLQALKRVGHAHGVAAVIHGRHDTITLARGDGIRARYTSVLDHNRCDECAEADDGVARKLDDPVRLEHQPPNQYCESLEGGLNQCRCFEVYTLDDDELVTLDAPVAVGDLPPYLSRIVTLLVSRGMNAGQAMTVATRVADQVAVGGHLRWPGLRQVGAADVDGAQDAVRWVAEHRG